MLGTAEMLMDEIAHRGLRLGLGKMRFPGRAFGAFDDGLDGVFEMERGIERTGEMRLGVGGKPVTFRQLHIGMMSDKRVGDRELELARGDDLIRRRGGFGEMDEMVGRRERPFLRRVRATIRDQHFL